MKKKQKQRIILITIVGIILGGIIGYNYYIDQVKIKGGIFSNQIETIQNELNQLQTQFSSAIIQYQEGSITQEEFEAIADEHIEDMQKLIQRYDELQPPQPFMTSVELFKLSAESQLERDRQEILLIQTGDESYSIRADELTQEAFQYELAALADFKAAQAGKNP